MLKAVCNVAKELCRACEPHELDLERITNMFKAITVIDQVYFVQFDTPEDNPIWGEFIRWTRQPSAYSSFETNVEIRYAKHLLEKEDWLRFVVCKELCHSLEAPTGKHDVSDRAVDDLVDKFSLLSSQQAISNITRGYHLEIMAEIAAIELLCPYPTRKMIIAEHGRLDAAKLAELAKKYNMPIDYVEGAFDMHHIEAIENLVNGA